MYGYVRLCSAIKIAFCKNSCILFILFQDPKYNLVIFLIITFYYFLLIVKLFVFDLLGKRSAKHENVNFIRKGLLFRWVRR